MAEPIFRGPVWFFFKKHWVILGNVLNKTMYNQPPIYMTAAFLESSLYILITQRNSLIYGRWVLALDNYKQLSRFHDNFSGQGTHLHLASLSHALQYLKPSPGSSPLPKFKQASLLNHVIIMTTKISPQNLPRCHLMEDISLFRTRNLNLLSDNNLCLCYTFFHNSVPITVLYTTYWLH